MAEKIKRSKIAIFMDTSATATPTWSLMGDGITEQTINYNVQTTEEIYVHEDSGTTLIESYNVTIPTPMTATAGDPVFDYVDAIRQARGVLDDAKATILIVYLYETAVAGEYPAEKCNTTIQIDDFGGPAGEAAKLNFTLNLAGDPEYGTFNPTTSAYTKNT